MAATTRQGTKTITMASAPEDSVPEPVTQRKQADSGRFRLQVDRQTKGRKARMRPMTPRKQREQGSRNTIQSFRSRCMTAWRLNKVIELP
jgi:hypothetical protein